MDISMDLAKELLGKKTAEAAELINNPSKLDDVLLKLEKKLKEVPAIGNTLADLPLMISMVKAWITKEYTEVSPKVIICMVGAFLYIISKKDLIPDNIPVVGYADDLAVLGLALNLSEPELKAFSNWRSAHGKGIKEKALVKNEIEFAGNKSVITPEAVFIIGTYDEQGVPNAMNAAWAMQSDTNEITIMLSKHKTTENFEKTGAFTVAFGTVDTVLISDYFGVESGKNVNKIEKAGCHVHRSAHVNAPIIEEYPLTLECQVKSWDPNTGYVVGEIVASQADESILTDGKVDLGKLKPIIFDPSFNVYRVIGETVGQAFKDGLQLK